MQLEISEFENALSNFSGHKESFEKTWKNLGASDAKEVYAYIIKSYQIPKKRAYHNITHIAYMLDGLSKIEYLAENLDELKIAIWFHDIIYEGPRKDNEEESARIARDKLIEKGANKQVALRIKELILTTKHGVTAKTNDEKLLSDLDLAVLGLDLESFKKYSNLLKKEYEFVGEENYWINRKAILEKYLKEDLFYHDYFKEKYEKQAIKNLQFGLKEAEKKIKEFD